MKNKEIAACLYEIADLLDVKGEDFKPNAYRRAARIIEGLGEDVEKLREHHRLESTKGIGEAIGKKIGEYLDNGRISLLERLKAEIPEGVKEMLNIPGVGPKTVRVIWTMLNVTTMEELKSALRAHRLSKLKGFGLKKEEKILKGIEFVVRAGKRTLLGTALYLATEIVDIIGKEPSVSRVTYAGSLRRMRETVGDLDFLVESTKHADVIRKFVSMPIVREVVASGDTKATVILTSGVQADIRVLDKNSWGSGLQYFTGSVDHNVRLRTLAIKQGLKLNEYGVFRGESQIAGESEEGVYESLGIEFIEPELREDTGEIEAAQSGNLPTLMKMEDVMGDFHVHTNASDGADSLEDMVNAAKKRGYQYIGIADHSQSLLVAHGLNEENLRIHIDDIRALNERIGGIRVLTGTECEILSNGDLDYPDDLLSDLDYVIAAIHSKFTMPKEEMTNRVTRAMAHPAVTILAHPFSGLINRREPIELDFERVVDQAVQSSTVLEINAYPDRLDLSGPQARIARERGAKIAINTDSHSIEELDNMLFGVATARRGWLEKDDVVNCWPLERVIELFSR